MAILILNKSNFKSSVPYITFFSLLIFLSISSSFAQKKNWVDSVFSGLNLEEKIGQLIIIRAPALENEALYPKVLSQIKTGVGGICFFAGNSEDQLRLTRTFQKESKIPLFISIDGEWGLGMRLKDAYSFPYPLMLGALPDEHLVYKMSSEIADQCKKMGIRINYAPACDINTNPLNPVIGNRSFGENKWNVTKKSLAYANGLEQNGVMAVAKHFPGHGDTEVDSHIDLPSILYSKERLDSVELFPFKRLIANNIGGVMIGHLYTPAYDSTLGLPASMSYPLISDMLRNDMKYKGFIFTDGLEMKGITKYYQGGNAELTALKAGVDILLLPVEGEKAIKTISLAAAKDSILMSMIDDRCKKVLQKKYELLQENAFDTNLLKLPSKEDKERAEFITKQIAEQSITLVRNQNRLIPLSSVSNMKTAWLSIESTNDTALKAMLEKYTGFTRFVISDVSQKKQNDSILKAINTFDIILVSCYGTTVNGAKRNYGFKPEIIKLVDSIQNKKGKSKLIVGLFGSPYILDQFSKMQQIDALYMAYQNLPVTQEAFVESVFGGIKTGGKLPVSSGTFTEGTSLTTEKNRLGFTTPDAYSIPSQYIKQIDSVAREGIIKKAYPGCQILIARDGNIFYNKSFGRQTYDTLSPLVTDTTYYDVASLTKIAATTVALMKLADEKKIDLDDPLSDYLPYLKKGDKKKITIKEALSHYAGLKSYSPFWRSVVQDKKLRDSILAVNPEIKDDFVLFSDSVYVKKQYKDALIDSIVQTPLMKQKMYVYSDFGFILLGDLVEHVTQQSLDVYMEENFYKPLGMRKTTFNPIQNKIQKKNIAPTENDTLFRKTVVQGFVHDQTAALMGGVAGHAGLFSTAEDLAKLLQMLLNGGTYGGKRYLSEGVIRKFNQSYFTKEGNRRALGFDKPLINGKSTHVSPYASRSSFGHTGFTGTMFWVDPDAQLVYIFLSNRVYPNAYPNTLSNMDIRTKIQNCIYESFKKITETGNK